MEKYNQDPEEKPKHLEHYQTSLRRETIHRIIEREQLSELTEEQVKEIIRGKIERVKILLAKHF